MYINININMKNPLNQGPLNRDSLCNNNNTVIFCNSNWVVGRLLHMTISSVLLTRKKTIKHINISCKCDNHQRIMYININ